ncbi:MAG: sigma-54-dependent Fis family transcriptional regulator [Nitrospirae bacterium]|nr:sigma-54-dependent Fis family transcriptional regulator [Nitrospirota bacterium]
MKRPTLLIIDDEPGNIQILSDILRGQGYEILTAGDGEGALKLISSRLIDLILCDLRVPKINGAEIVKRVRETHPHLPIIVMTAYGTVESAVNLIKSGVYEYLPKPLDYDKLQFVIGKALEQTRLLSEVEALRSQLQERYQFRNLIGKSKGMQEVYRLIARVADTDSTVLLEGETGTGKELAARAIHYSGQRKPGPFIAVSCAAFPEGLLESELFGHERGAFTGAVSEKKGDFELADGGTLFLDEIGSASPAAQAELLRVLQDKVFRRIGGTRNIQVDVRVIAATNQDLQQLVTQGRFRQDLFYRLHVIPIQLPPLRDRREDIPYLVEHFLRKFTPASGGKVMAPETLQVLYQHDWPGNVRELENLVERLVVTCDRDLISPEYLPAEIRRDPQGISDCIPQIPESGVTLDQMEEGLIRKTLEKTGGNRNMAASLLGVSRKVLWRKMKRYRMFPS